MLSRRMGEAAGTVQARTFRALKLMAALARARARSS
jgi:hypothetical protein